MTLRNNARVAGITFLLYIVTGVTSMVLYTRVIGGSDEFAKLKTIAHNATTVRVTVVLTMLTFVYAVVLGVTLYALTRDEDRELALIALFCRATEGAIAAFSCVRVLELVSVASIAVAPNTSEAQASSAYNLGALLLSQGSSTTSLAAICFVIASTIYCYLFWRARTIPVVLSLLGLIASLILLVALPLELAGAFKVSFALWMPMLVFEITFALWLIIKGVKPGRHRQIGEPVQA